MPTDGSKLGVSRLAAHWEGTGDLTKTENEKLKHACKEKGRCRQTRP